MRRRWMERNGHRGESIVLQAARWMIAVVLLIVGTSLLATAAYAAYIAKMWTAAARGEPAGPSRPAAERPHISQPPA
jgi:hypothetical protein